MNKIIYLKQEVSIGDIIDINGLKITITQKLVDDNPELFEVIEDIPEYVEAITSYDWYTKGDVYKVKALSNKCIGRCGYKNVYIVYYNDNSIEYYIPINDIKPSTKEAYEKQELLEEAKRRYPVGTKYKGLKGGSKYTITSDVNFEVINYCGGLGVDTKFGLGMVYNDSDGWAEILNPLFTTKDGVDKYKGDGVVIVYADTFSYDVQPVGWLNNFKPRPHELTFHSEEAAKQWIADNKPKTLKDYESILLNINGKSTIEDGHVEVWNCELYKWLKENEPKLYYTKVLELIAEDLNDGWVFKYPSGGVYHISDKINQYNYHCGGNEGCVYFKSRPTLEKAIEIMGDKLDYIFKQ